MLSEWKIVLREFSKVFSDVLQLPNYIDSEKKNSVGQLKWVSSPGNVVQGQNENSFLDFCSLIEIIKFH